MNTTNKDGSIPSDQATRILYTLEIIGRAHLHGGLHVSEALPLMQQAEVGAALDHLALFAGLIDAHNPPETAHDQA